MTLKKYVKDSLLSIGIYLFFASFMILTPMAFKVNASLIKALFFLLITMGITLFFTNFFRKKNFYTTLLSELDNLDQKYLITEIISRPAFLEGQIFHDALYEINKSMNEKIAKYELASKEAEDYVEMWIHEIKIPISSLFLMTHGKDEQMKKIQEQVRRIENDTEQILYYVRSENAEKDYRIKKCSLKTIVNQTILQNKDVLLKEKIELSIDCPHYVRTDSKWMQFILNQILSNAIKYHKGNPKVVFTSKEVKKNIVLEITDYGIGIPSSDLKKVFDKTFTGENGRIIPSATGMGLYICKQLCKKLGHKITITSVQSQYTKVSITFFKNEFYNVLS